MELEKAAGYIAGSFETSGLVAGGESGSYFDTWKENTGPDNKTLILKNIIGVIPGIDPELKEKAVIVGAHYDHIGLGWPDVHKGDEGKIHNGADDNASGISVMLELARLLAETPAPADP